MRGPLTIAAAAALAAGLGGCDRAAPANQTGGNSASIQIDRSAMRDLMLAGCRNGDPAAAAQLRQAGIDLERFCACSVDRFLQGVSDTELQRMNTNPNDARLQRASEQCVAQMTGQPALSAGNAADGAADEAAAPQ